MKRDTAIRGAVVVLMGMKHCGKSTLGRRLASSWQVRFHDLDDVVVQEYLDREGRPDRSEVPTIRAIYRAVGKEGFMELEARAASRIADGGVDSGAPVVALGGGTIENDTAIDAFSRDTVFVYLEDDAETLYRRIMRGGIPAFLSGDDPHGEFLRLYDFRTALYRQKATITVPLAGQNIDAAFDVLRTSIEEYLDGRQ